MIQIYCRQIELTMLVTASFTSSIRDSETISTKVACRDDEKKTTIKASI